jgi:hypothetical protein
MSEQYPGPWPGQTPGPTAGQPQAQPQWPGQIPGPAAWPAQPTQPLQQQPPQQPQPQWAQPLPQQQFAQQQQQQQPASPKPRRLHRRRTAVAAAIGLVLVLVGGYFGWSAVSSSAPQPNSTPFYYAAFNLAGQPMVRYSSSDPASGSSWNITVTSGGEESGTFTTSGEQYGVLEVGGVTYVKPPQADLDEIDTSIPVSDLQGQWLAGDTDVTGLIPQTLVPPEELADILLAGFGTGAPFPTVGAPTVQVAGRQALKAVLPEAVLYVAATAPYQVLEVDPTAAMAAAVGDGTTATAATPTEGATTGSATADAASYRRHAAAFTDADAGYHPSAQHAVVEDAADGGGLGQTSVQTMTQGADDQAYGNLISQTKTLNKAPDVGVDTEYSQNGDLSCTDTDCTVSDSVTTTTTSTQPAALSGGVSAVMTATVTVDGEAGGGCSQTQSLPLNGTATITCDDAGVAGDVAQIKESEQAQADAEGQDINYTINFLADVSVEAMADVQAQVTQQVDDEQAEQNAADQAAEDSAPCPANSFTAGTRVLMADGGTEPIQDVRTGDRIADAEPYSPLVQDDTVGATHVTTTDRDFVRLALAAPQGGVVQVTAGHLFYDRTTASWTQAAYLKPGDRLQTPGGGTATVASVRPYTTETATYNLSVDDVHTYYVLVGTTPVLVHNCSSDPVAKMSPAGRKSAANLQKAIDEEEQWTPDQVRKWLSPEQIAAGREEGVWLQRLFYGSALEKAVAENPLVEGDPNIEHLGTSAPGKSVPDFIVTDGSNEVNFDVTGPSTSALRAHLNRAYIDTPSQVLTYTAPSFEFLAEVFQ